MRLELRLPRKVDLTTVLRDYDESLDNITSILCDVCDALQDAGEGELVVSGFGQDRWPLDIRTDLSVLLEQLPEAIRCVCSGVEAELDFYEQGVERKLVFTPAGDSYDV